MNEFDFLGCSHAFHGMEGGDLRSVLLGKKAQYAPDRTFDTVHVRLDLDVDIRKKSVTGTCTTTVRAFHDGVRELTFDAVELKNVKALWAGKSCKVKYEGQKLTVRLPKALKAHEEGVVVIHYRLEKPRSGLHFIDASPSNGQQVWSQSQPEDARYWFPCHDAPQEKATSEVVATVPDGFTAVSNGVLLHKKKTGSKVQFHWKMEHPHSIYLICLSIGRFTEVKDNWENIPVPYYVEKGREADAKRAFGKTPAMLDFFSKKIGVRYPYEKYAQVAVAKYPGGMENTTCTTQTDAALIDARAALDTDFDGLVAHELAHQWFGDLLTCKDWSHAWLNEGFATYFEILFTEHDKGTDEALYEIWGYGKSYFHEDERRYRRPIVSAHYKYPWVLFDRHLYEKGANVLHLIRYLLRERDWWRAIQHYVEKHKNGSVETADLITAIQEATGKNLRSVFDQWVFGTGYPQFKGQFYWDAEKREAVVWLVQTQRGDGDSGMFRLPVEFYFEGRGYQKTFTEEVSKKEHEFRFKLPEAPLQGDLDPHRWILKKADLLKPLAWWERQLTHGLNSVARAEAARAVARWGSRASVKILADAFAREKFWGTRCEIAAALGGIRSEDALRALKPLLKNRHPKVRRSVVSAVGECGGREAAALLTPFLKRDASYHVEAEAARSLGRLKDPSLIRMLEGNLTKRSWLDVVRSGALAGLAGTRDPKVLPILKRWLKPGAELTARSSAARGLAAFHTQDPDVIHALIPYLEDKDERLRLTVISALGETGDVRAVPALEKARDDQANLRIKTYCDEAISRLRNGIEKEGGTQTRGKSKKPSRA